MPAILTLLLTSLAGAQIGVFFLAEGHIRRAAPTLVMPTYPATSLDWAIEGVAVSRVVASPDGRLQRVDDLQSPDAATAQAVRTALAGWTVRTPQPSPTESTHSAQAKITFYFASLTDGASWPIPIKCLATRMCSRHGIVPPLVAAAGPFLS